MKTYHVTYEFLGTEQKFTSTVLFDLINKLDDLEIDPNVVKDTIHIATTEKNK